MTAGRGLAVILAAWGTALLFLPRQPAVSVGEVEYPREVTCTEAFPVSFEVLNRGRKAVEASATVHFRGAGQNFVRLSPARRLPAGMTDGVPESVSFSPYDFDRASWPLGGYRLSIEVFSAGRTVEAWQAPEGTEVV